MNFEPQAVDKKSWRIWCVEGLQLSARRPLAFAALALAYASLYYLPQPIDVLLFILTPGFLGLGCMMAYAVDKSWPIRGVLSNTPPVVWARLVMVGFLPFIIAIIVVALFSILPHSGAEQQHIVTDVEFEGGFAILAMLFFWLLSTGYVLWLAVPLAANAHLALMKTAEQAFDALALNRFIWKLVFLTAGLCFLLMLLEAVFLAIPMFSILSCMMYASYRHIWLNRPKNDPASACRDNGLSIPLNEITSRRHTG